VCTGVYVSANVCYLYHHNTICTVDNAAMVHYSSVYACAFMCYLHC